MIPPQASGDALGRRRSETEWSGSSYPSSIDILRPWARRARSALPMAADITAVLVASVTAYVLWALPVRHQAPTVYLPAVPLLGLIVLGYAQAGLYPGFGLGPVEIIRRYWLVTIGAFVGLAALTFAVRAPDQYSRVTLVLAFALVMILVPLGRKLARRLGSRWTWWREPVLLVGSGNRTRMALEMVERSDEFQVVGRLAVDSEPEDGSGGPAPILGTVHDASKYAAAGVRMVFADLDRRGSTEILDELRLLFPRVLILREIQELPVEGVQVRNLGGVLGLEYSSNLLRSQSRWVKRALDLGLASGLFVVTLPLVLVSMLAVRLADSGPALFRQRRVGRDGRPIRVPKIRTMVSDADERMAEVIDADPLRREEWENSFKLKDDPRVIPRVGRLLRRFSIDELPQLWSVIRGDMSLVGPRPFPDYHLDALTPQARELRQRVRPGITGLWQVTSRGSAGVEAQETYDTYYIRNWSVWLDIYILARTFGAVIGGRGAH